MNLYSHQQSSFPSHPELGRPQSQKSFHIFITQCHTKRRLAWAVASWALFWYDNDKKSKYLLFAWHHSYDACHEKTDLKVFVVVIPKEGWVCPSSFWHDTDFSRKWSMTSAESNSEKSVSYQKKDGHSMTATKTLMSVFSWHASYLFAGCVYCSLCSLGEACSALCLCENTKWYRNSYSMTLIMLIYVIYYQ